MEMTEKLDLLLERAKVDSELKRRLLDTRKSDNPLDDVCKVRSFLWWKETV